MVVSFQTHVSPRMQGKSTCTMMFLELQKHQLLLEAVDFLWGKMTGGQEDFHVHFMVNSPVLHYLSIKYLRSGWASCSFTHYFLSNIYRVSYDFFLWMMLSCYCLYSCQQQQQQQEWPRCSGHHSKDRIFASLQKRVEDALCYYLPRQVFGSIYQVLTTC